MLLTHILSKYSLAYVINFPHGARTLDYQTEPHTIQCKADNSALSKGCLSEMGLTVASPVEIAVVLL